jgi:hypothetical protein
VRGKAKPLMPVVEFERRLVKSRYEVWDDLRSGTRLSRWLAGVRVTTIDPPHQLEWETPGARGLIKLESSAWGTTVRIQAETYGGPAWERLQTRYRLERSLLELLDDLSRSSLKRRAFAEERAGGGPVRRHWAAGSN